MPPSSIMLKLVLTALVIISGCSWTMSNAPEVKEITETSSEIESPYFYFTQAQIEILNDNLQQAVEYLSKAIALDPDSIYLKKELATLYLHLDDSDNALGIIEDILKKQPDDIETLIIYGKMKQIAKQNDEAKKIYAEVLSIDPQRQNIYLLLGGLFLDENDLNSAEATYNQLIRHFPESYVGHFFLGKIYALQKNMKAAEKKFLDTLELKPELIEPRFELIKLYKAAGKKAVYRKKIIAHYREILEIDPENVLAAMEYGLYYYQNNMRNKAAIIFGELGEKSQEDQEVFRKIVQYYIEPQKYKEAVILLEGMLKEVPDSSDLHYVAGVAYNGINNNQKAIKHFKQVLPDSKFYQRAVVHIAYLYQEQNRLVDAIAFLENALQELPGSTELMLYLGSFYEENEDYQKAESLFKQALEASPEDTRLLFRLGVIYDKWGKKDDSIEQMKKVIDLEPDNVNALNYLGYTYADLGRNLDEAERLIKEALKHKPDDGYIIDSLGWVYYKKGEYQKAVEILEEAVRLIQNDAVLLEHLGDAYLKLNRTQKALEAYQRALELKKEDHAELQQKIRQLLDQGYELK